MEILKCLAFLLSLGIATKLAVRLSAARRITLFGRMLGVLACFAAIRYFAIPLWTPNAKFWVYAKAVVELLSLHMLACAPAYEAKKGKLVIKAGAFSVLAIRLVFVFGLYLAFYDVISVWPAFGQAWYWVYIILMSVVGGWFWELWARHFLSLVARWLEELSQKAGGSNLGAKLRSGDLPPLPAGTGLSCLAALLLTLFTFAAFVYFVHCIVSSDYRRQTNDRVDDIVLVLRENVAKSMPAFKKKTSGIMQLWDKALKKDREILDKRHPRTADVRSRGAVKRSLAELREMLLPFDSRRVLLRIRQIDGDLASCKKTLRNLRERRGLHPEKAEKLDAEIAKAEKTLASLETARAEAMEKTRADLKAIGLDFPENSPFLMVDIGDLIDNAIIAKNTGLVVENLRTLVDAEKGNPETAKRYYGSYIVMLEIQSECFRQYLNKAAAGIWRNGVVEVAKIAETAKTANEAKAADEGRTEEEKAAYLHAAGTNEKTLKAAQAYLALLKRHEEIVQEKLATTETRHEIALSFWESVDIASSFGERAASDMADFAALLEFKLPEIAFFDDVAMREEFDAITEKLMKE